MKHTVRNKPLFKTPQANYKPRKWSLWRIVKKAVHRACTAIGALMLISLVFSFSAAIYFSGQKAPPLPDKMALILPVEGAFLEKEKPLSIQDPIPTDRLTIQQVIDTLRFAAKDDRVKGVLVALRSSNINFAHAQEIRTALKEFRKSGKFVRAYATSFGDTGNAFMSYYLASVASEIWMQPVGTMTISGLSAQLPFARNALSEIGVRPQFSKRKEYKSAVAPFTDSDMDAPTREMMTSLITDLGSQVVSGIAQERGLPEQVVKDLVDVGILLDEEALEAGLIDRLDYGDVLIREMNEEITGDPESKDVKIVGMKGYLARSRIQKAETMMEDGIAFADQPAVALVHVNGAIVSRTERAQAPFGNVQQLAAANEISEAIFNASKDDDVKAIILRVDSPGGSPTASESIRRAVVRAKERGKPVIVSMGATAASGGYWITPDADMIIANPGTLTGSIGVVGGKFVIKDLWDKLNVNWREISYGKSAGMWSPNKAFDPAELERFNDSLDRIYEQFIKRVAQGRGMSVEDVDKVARGRAWTGRQAFEKGLVDKVGGLDLAFEETAKIVGVQSVDDLRIIQLPRKDTLRDLIMKILQEQVALGHFMSRLSAALRSPEAQDVITRFGLYTRPSDFRVYADLELR